MNFANENIQFNIFVNTKNNISIKSKTVKSKTVKPKTVKSKTVKPKTVKSKTVKSKTVKSKTVKLLPSTTDKNGKKLTEYQRFMAVGLRKFSGNTYLTQKEKMQQLSTHWKILKNMPYIDKTQHLPSHLNYRLP